MKRTFNFKKGIFILLVVAATMASCSKDNDNPSTKVPQGAYGVFIGFAEITSDNYQNITSANFPDLKSGKVSYDPIHRILTLDGATIEATENELCAIAQPRGTTATLTIVLRNNNIVRAKEEATIATDGASLRITGDGSIKIENDNYLHASIFSRKQITIDGGCSIIANTHIRAVNTLNINKSNIQIIQNQGDYALLGGEGVILSNCEIVSPIGAITQKYTGYYSVVKDGRRCAEVKIVKNSF